MVHRISRCLDVRKLMTKEEYDPNNDGKISLGIIDIDQDLNMGSHNIVLDEGAKVDGVDISEHTHSLSVTSVSDNPTLYSHSVDNQAGEWKVGELTHDFNTEHALISYGIRFKNRSNYAYNFYIRLYINGQKVSEHNRNVTQYEEKKFGFLEVLEVQQGSGISVEVKVYVGVDKSYDLEGLSLVVKSYELLPPSQS